MFKYKLSTPQTKNYSTLFPTAGKAWASALEHAARKYGWISSGLNKLVFTPELNHHSPQSRHSGPLAQALPALQRSQRDTQRKNDMSRILAATEQLRANNRGKIPNSYTDSEGNFRRTFNETLREHYLTAGGDQFKDPDGSEYFFVDMIDSGDNYGRTDFSF